MVAIFPNNRRALLAFFHDVLMAALSVVASLYLRLGGDIVNYKPPLTITYIVSFTLIAASVFLFTGLYRGIWRYAPISSI
jgi:FlaA1/EpsC-like NDP-sugar epimerase